MFFSDNVLFQYTPIQTVLLDGCWVVFSMT